MVSWSRHAVYVAMAAIICCAFAGPVFADDKHKVVATWAFGYNDKSFVGYGSTKRNALKNARAVCLEQHVIDVFRQVCTYYHPKAVYTKFQNCGPACGILGMGEKPGDVIGFTKYGRVEKNCGCPGVDDAPSLDTCLQQFCSAKQEGAKLFSKEELKVDASGKCGYKWWRVKCGF